MPDFSLFTAKGHAQETPRQWQTLAMLAMGAGLAHVGQTAEAHDMDAANASASAISLSTVRVHSQTDVNSSNVQDKALGIRRMPGTVHDTPQTINVVPKELISEQKDYTLEQALENVPGITLSTGEGAGGLNGSQFRIRGQQARGDVYVNGLKDFGTYTRDMFNTESVEVIKGASGNYFGAGNVGGVINQNLKKANLHNEIDAEQAIGSGMQYRGTLDINRALGEHAALRINGMYNKQDIVNRNNLFSDRYGVAADLGLGLHTDTTWHLNYQWLKGREVPDYGVPMLLINGAPTSATGKYAPITEYGLSPKTTYARSFDKNNTDVHMLTSSLSSRLTAFLDVSNDTRFSHYHRLTSATAVSTCGTTTNCAAPFFRGQNPNLPYGAGGGLAYDQDGYGVQNISMLHANVSTWRFSHDVRAGVDINYNRDARILGTYVNRVNNQKLINPQYDYSNVSITFPSTGTRITGFRDLGLFISDRIALTKHVMVSGAVRWDSFESTYWNAMTANRGTQSQKSDRFSPSANLIYNFNDAINAYFTYSRSYKPVGADGSSLVVLSEGNGDVAANGRDLSPQRSDLYEVGAKADLLQKRLGLTAALYKINQNRSFAYDPLGNLIVGSLDSGSGRRTHGVELSATGQITRDWGIYANYAYMAGKVRDSALYDGKRAPQLPRNNFSIFTTYDLSRLLLGQEKGDLLIGGGARYNSAYFANESNNARVPYGFSLNTMMSYKIGRYRVQFNANNLTNHVNYSSAFSFGRAVPQSGRIFLGNVGITF
ncbi:TonB-dependent receptor [Neokomagataea tanensis]|uniref:TonB-dependent receptor n=2 Tax=Neokomagataea TaxID=1223423 RepID=A0A4Y6VBY3_9PROT|nr:TonB-dependent receptor [Neokomagataea tanensis]